MRNTLIAMVLTGAMVAIPLSFKINSVVKERDELIVMADKTNDLVRNSQKQTARAIAIGEESLYIATQLKDLCELKENKQ